MVEVIGKSPNRETDAHCGDVARRPDRFNLGSSFRCNRYKPSRQALISLR